MEGVGRLRQFFGREVVEVLIEDKPWENGFCPICEELKIEVVIFWGNDRNHRREFHNT